MENIIDIIKSDEQKIIDLAHISKSAGTINVPSEDGYKNIEFFWWVQNITTDTDGAGQEHLEDIEYRIDVFAYKLGITTEEVNFVEEFIAENEYELLRDHIDWDEIEK